jgi:hypothetical protein
VSTNADLVSADPAITAAAEEDVVIANVKAPASPVPQSGPIRRLSESIKRFISSFRGRTVHGVEVTLPNGYVGLVLRGDANGQSHTRQQQEISSMVLHDVLIESPLKKKNWTRVTRHRLKTKTGAQSES